MFPESKAVVGLVTDLDSLEVVEIRTGKKHGIIKIYQAFWHKSFWIDVADRICDHGSTQFLSFDPNTKDGDTEIGLTPCQVLSGEYDGITARFASQIKDWGEPVFLSTAGEMNGNWSEWSGARNFGPDWGQSYQNSEDVYREYGSKDTELTSADGPERYRDMYRHIHNIFTTVGATNVIWVWMVNHASFPPASIAPWNSFTNYYPGDEYVDVISANGYNWANVMAYGRPFLKYLPAP